MINFLTRPKFQMSSSGSFGGGGVIPVNSVLTLTPDVGTMPVVPDGAGNIDTLGGNLIQTTGGLNQITWDLVGGLDGQVIIGATAGSPAFANITSGDGTITFITGPNTLDIRANAGAIDLSQLTGDVGAASIPLAGNINIISDSTYAFNNINTESDFPSGDDLVIRLNNWIKWPTCSDAMTGNITLDSERFMHNYGDGGSSDNNTWLGALAGNFTMGAAAAENTGIGADVLSALTTGDSNTVVGSGSMVAATTSSDNVVMGVQAAISGTDLQQNVLIGFSVAQNLINGGNNIAIGAFSGDAWTTGSESDNIYLGSILSDGVGESNTMRLGDDGLGSGQQDAAYMAGVFNRSFGATSRLMFIDSNFKVGSATGANGEIPIGGGTGPVFNTITAGTGISITNGVNSITIDATGGAEDFVTDAGTANPVGGALNVLGGELINTAGAGDTVTVNLDRATTGEIIIAKTGAASEYGTLFSSDNSIDITTDVTVSGSFTIDLRADGGVAGRGAFKAIQTFVAPNVMGTLTNLQYLLGDGGGAGLTVLYDPSSSVFAGNGAGSELTYTAQVDGIYRFQMSVEFTGLNALTGVGVNITQGALLYFEFIVNGSPDTTFFMNATDFTAVAGASGAKYALRTEGATNVDLLGLNMLDRSVDIELSAGDVVTFGPRVAQFSGSPGAYTIADAISVGSTSGYNGTFVSGHLITPI